MARKTKEEALATRNNILDAAATVFYENGLQGASLEDIARRAGVTRGAVYWHFKNKSDIFYAVHERLHGGYMAMLEELLEREGSRLTLPAMESFFVAKFKELDGDKHRREMLNLCMFHCNDPEDAAAFRARQREYKRCAAALLEKMFTRVEAGGGLKPDLPARDVAPMFSTLMSGILFESQNDSEFFDITRDVPALLRAFFASVRK